MSAISAMRIHQKTGFHFDNAALRNLCCLSCQRGRPSSCSLSFELSRDVSSLAETSAAIARKTPTRSIVLLAAAGFAGPSTVLEGEFGFLRVFCSEFDVGALTCGLGEEYVTLSTVLKR